MRIKLSATLAFVFFVCQHLQIFSLLGFPVTLGAVCGIALLFLVSRPASLVNLIYSSCALIALSGCAAMLASGDGDLVQYFRTLALFLVATSFIVLGSAGVDERFLDSKALHIAIVSALVVVVALSVGQVALGMRGSVALFNPFGKHQYLYEYNPHLEFVDIPRAQGFYLEPSYNAFVICTLAVILFCLNKSRKFAAILVTCGLLACQSASGLLLMVAVLVCVIFRARPAVGVVSGFILALIVWFAGPYLLARLGSLDESSTSANYRIVAPLNVLSDVLLNKPMGEPLGSVSTVMERYGLQNGTSRGTSLDNGFYVIVFYFGWVGLIALVSFLIAVLYLAFKRSKADSGITWIAPIWLLGSFMFSGGIMLPEFALMTWFVIAAFNHFYPSKGSKFVCRPNTTTFVRGHNYIQRSRRARANA